MDKSEGKKKAREDREKGASGTGNVCQYWKLHAKSRATFTGQLNYSE